MTVARGYCEDDRVEGRLNARDYGVGSVVKSVGASAKSTAGSGKWARATIYGRTGAVSQMAYSSMAAHNAWRAYVRRVSAVAEKAALVPLAGVVSSSGSGLVESVTPPCCKFAAANLLLIS